MRQALYFDRAVNEAPSLLPQVFPTPTTRTLGFYQVGNGSSVPFSVLMLDTTPDLHVTGAGSGGQFFPRWRFEKVADAEMLDLADGVVNGNGRRRVDNITDAALKRFAAAYPDEVISKDDIFFYVYGLLHSPEYRDTYAADLKKMLPRVPYIRDFHAYARAGCSLSSLHLGYEAVQPYPLAGLDAAPEGDISAFDFFAVDNKRMTFGKPSPEQKAAGERHDRSVIHYNKHIDLSGIPDDAYRYVVGSRSAIEWVIDRYYVKTDKPSGIVNDPNDWSREHANPRYIIDLLAKVISVSVETMNIVDSLPPFDVID